ncbi:muscarinic acetylcholine receptor M2a [Triplophysa dalaica]|uniref:muscarinic acetylcholine receptor M2a n=1 Tax=Triplophysa dalaica TaxID=1582913 RepID=UPI0024DF8C21|nr:muscarinic acetylcholine receptor M2a [Triplophysa dalaica]XP_056603949.1 muscarinic acetylcholine receptor M2a [Triplophysa dalaica]XP_056603950.1 muscarinic acetylcholine receptor M2a [Triplophysa dalaica]XP_056603951.1 muscarinic acetylcholine receptor M2a [Triplophysa dalaica]XP_056603952.1 muscarinic acetylcholine receptor M2a [Triplophysa dalaica]XP_056603953.1 muscarinic acetylcholine receptor M2a [Triplophysa dalaica]XP_056603954.1 muscarinic acetylcholine receptor M2a [Triplophysa
MDTINFTFWNASEGNETDEMVADESPYKTVEVVFIVLVAGSLSLVTVIGNILVMLSIKVNRSLQTVNNYFLFSLACADLIIGLCSMNLYTVYIVIGYWPLGPVVCDLWLALDYVVSNASVMNLLIISFDRYFCVTKPLSYPVKRTTKMAGMMIAAAWVLSFILWAPAILFWQFIVGGRTVPEKECYIQFFSNAAVTFGTAIAAFYLPVIIMMVLYWQISRASKSRVKKENRKPSGANLEVASPSQMRENTANKPTNNNVTVEDAERGQTQVTEDAANQDDAKLQNGKASSADEGVRGNCVPGEEKESSNDSTSGSGGVTNQKDEAAPSVPNDAPARRRAKSGGSKLTCIKIITKSPKGDCYASSNAKVEIVPATERQNHVARKIVKMTKQPPKKKKAPSSREKKVTRTIMAILVAFVATWTPYNVMVLINTFCSSCIPNTVWTIGYWLCYINSTINPACYALCNITFKKTFKQLLLCQYKNIRSIR